ncbi:hypothetical protein L1987_11751 [Smallanthus sonchifolius]|uniref:Uncharacterized protein n=1 Tax=Smallanthus sonchifolius TaxID=185202 RepID=A0ACB9JCB6_9ASTR|nr:hypothetical protein L1987_11751 [Smallanthus sonchifolius]
MESTVNWVGSGVCDYNGVFYAHQITTPKQPSSESISTTATLPEEIGLLTDLALFHINSNRFCGTIPKKFKNLKILFELDISNNRFAGKFPYVVLKLPELKFLDLRFNEFEGKVPRLSSGEYWEHVGYFE